LPACSGVSSGLTTTSMDLCQPLDALFGIRIPGIAVIDLLYSKLVRKDGGNDGIVLVGCWSHSRRKFHEFSGGRP
jgi:hypothetical protein